MYFTLQSTALSSLLLVLALSTLLSPVHAVPLTARADPPRYEGYTIDKTGSRLAEVGIRIPQTNAAEIIKRVVLTALPDAVFEPGPLPISAATKADKDFQMMYAKITGPECDPCYLWSARSIASGTRFGALLHRDESGHVVPFGNAKGSGKNPTSSRQWKDFNDRALNELEPLKSWVDAARNPMSLGNILN